MPAGGQDKADSGHKFCAALFRRDILHVFQQLIVVGFIVAVVAAVAGAVNPRGPIQSIHAEAGVIGDGGHAAGFADGLGLDEGVFLKSGAGLIGFNGDAKLLLADHLVALRFQNAPQFTELTGVAGRCTNFHVFLLSAPVELLHLAPLPGELDAPKRGLRGLIADSFDT